MNSAQLKEIVRHIVKEIVTEKKLREVSATGGVSCPATKMAWNANKKSNGNERAATSSTGFTIVDGPSAEVNEETELDAINEGKKATKKKFENPAPKEDKPINEPIHRSDVDYINKEKKSAVTKKDTKKVKSITKLQQLVKRAAPFYRIDEADAAPAAPAAPAPTGGVQLNIKRDMDALDASIEANKVKIINAKIAELKQKLLNKQVSIHASKGSFGQPILGDYTIAVSNIGIESVKNKFQLVLTGAEAGTKESKQKRYFIDTSRVITILGPAAAAPAVAPAATPAPAAAPTQDKLSGEIQK